MQKDFVIKILPTDFCHASTITKLSENNFMCCWFGGTKEGASDSAIWGSRYCEGMWQEPVMLVNGSQANWNPVLFRKDENTLLLFYKEGQDIKDWHTFIKASCDNGVTWSEPVEMVAGDNSGGRGPVRNKMLRLQDGSTLAGGSVERGIWSAFCDVTDDFITWAKSAPVKIADLSYDGAKTAESDIEVSQQSFYGRGVIQPSLWESKPGRVHMLLRSSEGSVYRSDSMDGGLSWSDAYPVNLPNNNSGIDVVKADFDGNLYLVCNPVAANWGMRSPLTLLKSEDNGFTWRRVMDLETEKGEFSYPAIIADANGLVITYTWKRKNIVCLKIDKEDL